MSIQASGATSGSASQAVAAAAAANNGSGTENKGTQTASGAEGGTAQAKTEETKPRASMLAGGADAEKKAGTDGQAASGDKSKDEKSAEAGKLTITLPEGVQVSKEDLAAFESFATNEKMSGELASKLVAYQAERVKAAEAAWAKQGDEWFAQLEKDPDFGGKNLEKSQASVRRTVAAFFDDRTLADFQAMGVDNHPGFVKALARIGERLRDDDGSVGAGGNSAVKAAADQDQQLKERYPTMQPKAG